MQWKKSRALASCQVSQELLVIPTPNREVWKRKTHPAHLLERPTSTCTVPRLKACCPRFHLYESEKRSCKRKRATQGPAPASKLHNTLQSPTHCLYRMLKCRLRFTAQVCFARLASLGAQRRCSAEMELPATAQRKPDKPGAGQSQAGAGKGVFHQQK